MSQQNHAGFQMILHQTGTAHYGKDVRIPKFRSLMGKHTGHWPTVHVGVLTVSHSMSDYLGQGGEHV